MVNLPDTTRLHRRVPKEAFYSNLQLSAGVKNAFVTDLDRVFIEYGLSKDGLNLSKDSDLEVFYIMRLELKKQDYDPRIVEAIARQNPHKLLFVLSFDQLACLAVYQGKLYSTEWSPEVELRLEAHGQSLREIWDNFIAQIALTGEHPGDVSGLSVEERLKRQESVRYLEKQIASLQGKIKKEKQLNKQVQLNTELKKLRKELKEL